MFVFIYIAMGRFAIRRQIIYIMQQGCSTLGMGDLVCRTITMVFVVWYGYERFRDLM